MTRRAVLCRLRETRNKNGAKRSMVKELGGNVTVLGVYYKTVDRFLFGGF